MTQQVTKQKIAGLKRRKYDHESIIIDYKNGLSLPNLKTKYGIATSTACRILEKNQIPRRTSSESVLKAHTNNQVEWHKLCSMNHHSTRIISIPYAYLQQFGFATHDTIEGKWQKTSEGLLLILKHSES
jgi:hypothetical protein